MSYTPTNADATAVSADTIARLNATSPSSHAAVSDQSVALADAMLRAVGYQGQSDAALLGVASTTSNSFVDIGNGSSTGFASYTFAAPIAKTYLVHVDTALYFSVAGSFAGMWLQVVNTTTGVNYTGPCMLSEMPVVNSLFRISFRVPVAMNAGNNTLKLQWKAGTGATINLDAQSFRTYTVTG